DVQLIDLRDPAETQDTGLPGARLVPLAALTESLDDLDRAAPVVVYCASGYRSSIAASVLVAAGFADVSDLRGGFAAWESACAR
ncbi:MAG TPA: rhodanese-like domain-containing protein, partial [Desertimonas sp.]|nr:rhodanese-like domain-containing protein [Desertimonas sp.]